MLLSYHAASYCTQVRSLAVTHFPQKASAVITMLHVYPCLHKTRFLCVCHSLISAHYEEFVALFC